MILETGIQRPSSIMYDFGSIRLLHYLGFPSAETQIGSANTNMQGIENFYILSLLAACAKRCSLEASLNWEARTNFVSVSRVGKR